MSEGARGRERKRKDGRGSERFNRGGSRVDDNSVSEVGSHNDIVLDDERSLLGVEDVSVGGTRVRTRHSRGEKSSDRTA